MSDNLSPRDRRKAMQAVKSKGTKPERQLFAMLAGMGLRGWRKHADEIIGKPDVVFDEKKIAVFVDGCFWHGCPHCKRPLKPKSNQAYWERKIRRNIERADKYNQQLRQEGWIVVRIWEHEIKEPAYREQIRQRIRQAVDGQNDE